MSILILRGLLLASEALVISALLPLLAWATGLFLRRNAALRHLVWLAAFGVLLALPLLALMAPPRMLMLQQAASVPVDIAVAAPVAATYAQSWSVEAIIAVAAAPLCALWLLGVAWNLLRLALGAHGLMRLRRSSTAFDRIANCDVRLGGGPLTFGLFKPLIILPFDAPRWSRDRLDAVLRHELAHVRRHDSATQWLAALACAFYWPNPLIWLGAKALRRDAEMAADDAVLAAGVQPSVYAAELVRLAADARPGNRFAVAMATPSSLEARVTSVLSPTPSRAGVTPMDALKLGLLGGACALALAFARPDIALAQTPAPVTSAPLAPPATPDMPVTAQAAATPEVHKTHHVRNVTVDRQDGPDGTDIHVVEDKDGERIERHIHAGMTVADREQVRQAMQQVKVELSGIRPQMEKAMAEAHASMEQARVIQANAHVTEQAWRQAAQEIHQAVDQAMAEVRPLMREAARDPQAGERIGQKVSEAMAKAQPRIDAAIARANVAVHVHVGDVPEAPPAPPAPPAAPPPPPAAPAPPAPVQ